MNSDNLGPNIRRLAGAHDVPLERVAEAVDLSRAGMMKLVGKNPPKSPKATTVIKIAGVFNVSVEDLYAEPEQLLQSAAVNYRVAPIRKLAENSNVKPLRQKRK
jgi:transcriptional regulator with XRE-family HTH domain